MTTSVTAPRVPQVSTSPQIVGSSWSRLTLANLFVGRHLEEEMLVRAGHAYQSATDWHRRHPVLPTD